MATFLHNYKPSHDLYTTTSGLQSAVALLCAMARLPAPVHCGDMSWSGSSLHSIVSILLREQNLDGKSDYSIPVQTNGGERRWMVETCVSVQGLVIIITLLLQLQLVTNCRTRARVHRQQQPRHVCQCQMSAYVLGQT